MTPKLRLWASQIIEIIKQEAQNWRPEAQKWRLGLGNENRSQNMCPKDEDRVMEEPGSGGRLGHNRRRTYEGHSPLRAGTEEPEADTRRTLPPAGRKGPTGSGHAKARSPLQAGTDEPEADMRRPFCLCGPEGIGPVGPIY